MSIGCFSMQQFKDENSECPNIGFRTINVMNKSLRSHINGRSNIDVFEIIPNLSIKLLRKLGEPKICNLSSPIMKENIGYLKISMNDVFFSQIQQT